MNHVHDSGAVQSLHDDYKNLCEDLKFSPSGLAALNRSYHKHILLAAASSLEDDVKNLITKVFENHGNNSLSNFVSKRVMARQYHTLFDWKEGKANSFFNSFGDSCGSRFKSDLKEDLILKEQHDAFMQLGQRRNLLVHNNYAIAPVELTPEEIMVKYILAKKFTERIEDYILIDQ